jgi:lysophospholipase L1-like esterase
MHPAIAWVGMATVAVGASAVGFVTGVSAGVTACTIPGSTVVNQPAPSAQPTPSPTQSKTPTDTALAAVQFQQVAEPQATPTSTIPGLEGGEWNPVLWQAVVSDVHSNPLKVLVELDGSYLEAKWRDVDPGDGSDGPWQIQYTAHTEVSPDQARDPVWSTHWIQQLYGPVFDSLTASTKALFKSNPAKAAALVAAAAESPQGLGYWYDRNQDALLGYKAAVYVMGHVLGLPTSQFPDTDQVTAGGTLCSPNSTPQQVVAYQMGDSLTVGMRDQGALAQKYTDQGIQVAQIDATSGIGITASTAALSNDVSAVESANVAVIELGTNDYESSQSEDEKAIDDLVAKIKAINQSIKLYWVNTFSTKLDMDRINAAIAARANQDGYTVIDWHKEANDNPSKYAFDSVSGVHQNSSAGYGNMSKFLVGQLPVGGSPTPIPSADAPSYCRNGTAYGAYKIVCSAWLFDGYGYNDPGYRGNADFLKGFLADVKTCVTGNYGAGCKYPEGTLLVDCSALVDAAVYDAYGIDLGGAATGGYPNAPQLTEIPFSEAQAGDIVWNSGHTEIIMTNNPATQTLTTFGAHMKYPDVTKDISPANYNYSYFTKVCRVKPLQA